MGCSTVARPQALKAASQSSRAKPRSVSVNSSGENSNRRSLPGMASASRRICSTACTTILRVSSWERLNTCCMCSSEAAQ